MGVRVFIEPDGWTKEGQSQVVELKESLLWDGQQYMWSESSPSRLSAVSLLFAVNRYTVLLGWLPAFALAFSDVYISNEVDYIFSHLTTHLSVNMQG